MTVNEYCNINNTEIVSVKTMSVAGCIEIYTLSNGQCIITESGVICD